MMIMINIESEIKRLTENITRLQRIPTNLEGSAIAKRAYSEVRVIANEGTPRHAIYLRYKKPIDDSFKLEAQLPYVSKRVS